MQLIESRLDELIAEKEEREQRTLSVRRVTEESGASRSTVERLFNNTIKRVPLDELAALCRYLKCEVGDMLVLTESNDFPAELQAISQPLIAHPPYLGFELA